MLTKGFDPARLVEHFDKHVIKLKNISAVDFRDYENLADQFMGGPKRPSVLECKRGGGDTIRFDCKSDEYGIVDSNGMIRTYFKPDPARHGKGSNLNYLCLECRTVFRPAGQKSII